jgi:hypothetical protein
VLDSNEFIFGILATKASCARLMEQLGTLRVYVPSMVVREVRDTFQREYHLGKAFFRLLSQQENITIIWSDPPESLVVKYTGFGFAEEDAAIAACAEWVGANYIVSENRHFLRRSEPLVFEIVDAETALSQLEV